LGIASAGSSRVLTAVGSERRQRRHRRRGSTSGGVSSAKWTISEVSIPLPSSRWVIEARGSGPVVGPGGEVLVHRVGELFERTFIRQRLPALASMKGEPIRTGTKRRQAEPGIGTVLVATPDDQVAPADGHLEATRRLAGFQQRLERGGDRW
jgi:hypothetical protein